MDKEEYDRIHQASRTLPKLMTNIAWTNIKNWDLVRKKRQGINHIPLSKIELIEEAFKCLLLSSQALFKPDLKIGFHTMEHEGILVLIPGCTSLQLEDLIGTEIVLALRADKQLIRKLVLHKHIFHIPMGIRNVHRPLNLTLQETRLPPFSHYFFQCQEEGSQHSTQILHPVQEKCPNPCTLGHLAIQPIKQESSLI